MLDSGVNPNFRNIVSDSPLISASFDGHTEIVKLLLESGADPNIGYRHGYTPLIFASKKGHSDVARLLLEHGADINIRDRDGKTPLIFASKKGHTNVVRLLLERGADINIRGKYGNTPLIFASDKGHSDVVRLLLERGADINIQNNYGRTSLHGATQFDHSDIVKLLLENGADPTIKEDNFDETAYDIALDNGNREIARLIQYYIDLQRMQRPQQNLAFMKYFLDRDDLDIDTASKIFSNVYSYNPSVNMRMINEYKKDPLTKSKQRLAIMKGIHDRNSVLQYLREPELMENVNEYLSSIRPQPSVHSRLMLEDKQRGSGNYGKKRSKKRSKKTKKRNYRF